MKKHNTLMKVKIFLLMTAFLLLAFPAMAEIQGINGSTFDLHAKADHITTGEGNSLLVWGFTTGPRAQYPGPTMIVNQGDTVTINLTNDLTSVPVSMVFPGHRVTATGGTPGLLTSEAASGGGTVSYSFVATDPGTYMYHSGTNPALQIDMGLIGVLLVRPTGFDAAVDARRTAYGEGTETDYDYEVLFLHTEMDPRYHDLIEFGRMAEVDTTDFRPVYWFYNGRNGPDTLLKANLPSMPIQPYNTLPMIHPGDKLLVRHVGGGRDPHPTHQHGNNFYRVAKDGRMFSSNGTVADLAVSANTQAVYPGETHDVIFTWTGKKMGWDMYDTVANNPHDCVDSFDNETGAAGPDGFSDLTSDYPWEWCGDHNVEIPVSLPGPMEVTFSPFYSGSPYMGVTGDLPPGEGGFNPWAGYFYPWHSHAEKELVNNDIFPGGMLTFLIIVPPGTPDLK